MLASSDTYAREFSVLFHPIGGEYDMERRHPKSVQTLVNVTGYSAYIEDLREALRPEFDLIASKVLTPAQELEAITKMIDKAVTKRDHKLVDFDRHSNSYVKLKEKSNRSAKEDTALFKLESEFETASADYEYHNNLLKEELPKFLEYAERMISPLFYSLYYMQYVERARTH